jgi:hypothetical protein
MYSILLAMVDNGKESLVLASTFTIVISPLSILVQWEKTRGISRIANKSFLIISIL